jgi:type IV secretory pathway VirB2 component (pilin)
MFYKLLKVMRIAKVTFFTLLLGFFSVGQVFAQAANPPEISGLTDIFQNIIFNLAPKFAGLVAVIMVVVGGFMWMTSEGDPQKLQSAKGTLTWAALGLVFISIFSYFIYLILDFFGISY